MQSVYDSNMKDRSYFGQILPSLHPRREQVKQLHRRSNEQWYDVRQRCRFVCRQLIESNVCSILLRCNQFHPAVEPVHEKNHHTGLEKGTRDANDSAIKVDRVGDRDIRNQAAHHNIQQTAIDELISLGA